VFFSFDKKSGEILIGVIQEEGGFQIPSMRVSRNESHTDGIRSMIEQLCPDSYASGDFFFSCKGFINQKGENKYTAIYRIDVDRSEKKDNINWMSAEQIASSFDIDDTHTHNQKQEIIGSCIYNASEETEVKRHKTSM